MRDGPSAPYFERAATHSVDGHRSKRGGFVQNWGANRNAEKLKNRTKQQFFEHRRTGGQSARRLRRDRSGFLRQSSGKREANYAGRALAGERKAALSHSLAAKKKSPSFRLGRNEGDCIHSAPHLRKRGFVVNVI